MHWNFLPHLKMESQMPDATTTEGKLYFKNSQPLMTRPKYPIQSDPTKCDHQCTMEFFNTIGQLRVTSILYYYF